MENEKAWVPNESELDEFSEAMSDAVQADTRSISKETLKQKINALRAELGIGPLPDSAFEKLFMLPSEENNYSWSEQVSFAAEEEYKEWDGSVDSDPDLWEPTEDTPMLYFKENYPIPEKPKIIAFDENGNAYSLKALFGGLPKWRLEGHWNSQQEAIDFYFYYGFESEVL